MLGCCPVVLLLFCILFHYSISDVSSCLFIFYFGIVLSLLLFFLKINTPLPQQQQQQTPDNPTNIKTIATIKTILINTTEFNGQHAIKEIAKANTTRNK